MGKMTSRFWMILAAALAGGSFALLGALSTLPARVVAATVGGALVGITLYLHGQMQRS